MGFWGAGGGLAFGCLGFPAGCWFGGFMVFPGFVILVRGWYNITSMGFWWFWWFGRFLVVFGLV